MSISIMKVVISNQILRNKQAEDRIERCKMLWNRFEGDSDQNDLALALGGSNAQSNYLDGKCTNNISITQENAGNILDYSQGGNKSGDVR